MAAASILYHKLQLMSINSALTFDQFTLRNTYTHCSLSRDVCVTGVITGVCLQRITPLNVNVERLTKRKRQDEREVTDNSIF